MFDDERMKWIKLSGLCVLILLFGIFLGKNYTPTPVWLFLWTPTVPLILIVVFSVLFGAVCGWLFTFYWRKRME